MIDTLQKKLASGLMPGRILLDQLKFLDENSRRSAAYCDSKYVSFYYYLGGLIQPKTFLEIGFNLGLLGACFLKACKTVEEYQGFQQIDETYYSPRLGTANIKNNYKGSMDVYVGSFSEFIPKISEKLWDLTIINEEASFDRHLLCFDLVWQQMPLDGIMVVESLNRHLPTKEAFLSFSSGKNREPTLFKTRYGTGLLKK